MSKKIKTDNNAHDSHRKYLDFPVVGIGASAGGLEALEAFFSAMPSKPGAAFVVVQHLSKNYKSLMDELLARHTRMKINRVSNGMEIKANEVFLIPAGKNMTLFNGKLLLSDQKTGQHLNLPIDIFLRSLAADQEKNAIGIILSGTGSDGTLGIRAIKENGGIAMVQDDKTAKFNGMPRSSISTGMVDFILAPHKIAEVLVNYIQHPLVNKTSQIEEMLDDNFQDLQQILSIIRDVKGVDFSDYKANTILRRLEKRISINRFNQFNEYLKYLTSNEKEVNILFDELLIGVTNFFRDNEAFELIEKVVIPNLAEKYKNNEGIRVWVAGCSTGEEAYSLAMLFREYERIHNVILNVKIFATDLDQKSIEYAAVGIYPGSIASDLPKAFLTRYFKQIVEGYQVNESIRSMIIFARHNLLGDPPFSKIDLLSCRNVLIYLDNKVQQNLISQFYHSLNENAYLFLGSSESLGHVSEGFDVINQKAKIFQQIPGYSTPHMLLGRTSSSHKTRSELSSSGLTTRRRPSQVKFENLLEDIVSDFLPPSIILDEQYTIIHIVKDVSNIVKFSGGTVNLNILKMLPQDISVIVSSILRKLQKSDQTVRIEDIKPKSLKLSSLSISGKKLYDDTSDMNYFMLSFKENVKPQKQIDDKIESLDVNEQYQERVKELEQELQHKSESLQATVEELETSNEELQSSNEELIASNEELQSTNEELQSVNEELYTVNSEYVRKIDELTELNADMDNLLTNTQVGALYLDNKLNIRKINPIATNITDILGSDVGRPLEHLSLKKLYADFYQDVRGVLLDLKAVSKDIHTDDGTWYLMKILPYRNADMAVNGVIVTFIDITSLHEVQSQALKLTERLEMAMNIGEISWWDWNVKTNKVKAGRLKSTMLGYEYGSVGSDLSAWTDLIHPDDKEDAMQAMRSHLNGDAPFYEAIYRIRCADGNYLWYKDKGALINRPEKDEKFVTGVVMNISAQMENKQEILAQKKAFNSCLSKEIQRHDLLFETSPIGIVYQKNTGEIVMANKAAENLLGQTCAQLTGKDSMDEDWKSIKPDGSDFPGTEHPAMVAIKTKREVHDAIMGVYHPKRKAHVWLKVDAIPLVNENQDVFMVYTMFTETKAN